jgi:G:T/U-mismatch repair DNA glycosylase
VFFNGRKAESIFSKKVKPALKLPGIAFHLLPSTSPAYAALGYEQKLKAWELLLRRAGR